MRTLKSQIGWCSRAQLMLAGVMVGAVGLFFMAGYRPQNARWHELNLQIAIQQRELEASTDRARNLPAVAREVEALKSKLENFKKLPTQPDLGEFMRQITQISQRSSLHKLLVQPGVPRRSDLYYQLPISLTFEGDFLSVFSFLREAEDMQRLTRVRNMSIRCTDSQQGHVQAQVAMDIYFSEG